MIPFQGPRRYGRSPLENSSFLVSSAHPDEFIHGTGFVARLSGATAEFLSIWQIMMAGKKPFIIQNGELCLAFNPVLPGWMFDGDDSISFTFLGTCQVVYDNPRRVDTFKNGNSKLVKLSLGLNSGKEIDIEGNVICAPYAEMVRRGEVHSIRARFQ